MFSKLINLLVLLITCINLENACWGSDSDDEELSGINAFYSSSPQDSMDDSSMEEESTLDPLISSINEKGTSLEAEGDPELLSLEGIEQYPNLLNIYIGDTKIKDISPLLACPKIENLEANNTLIKKFNIISSLYQLQELYLSNTDFEDCGVLSNLSELRWLDLHNTRPLRNLDTLRHLPKLAKIRFGRGNLQTIKAIPVVKSLTHLIIKDGGFKTPLTSLMHFEIFPQLREFNLNGTPYTQTAGDELLAAKPSLKITEEEVFLNDPL